VWHSTIARQVLGEDLPGKEEANIDPKTKVQQNVI